MANFETPFASAAARRSPNADEKANGFPCGPADQTLFNGMFHRIEAELGNLIAYAGLPGNDSDLSQVRKAVMSLIDSATGGGAAANYLLLSQAAARLPIFPEVMSTDGRINFTVPALGTVRLPGDVGILHRGINLINTVQTDFNTLANRTYHIRWNPVDGFQMKLLTDNNYNPDGHGEAHGMFDSTYDDVLLARVVTNSGNVATITPTANKAVLRLQSNTGEFNSNPGSLEVTTFIEDITKYKTINIAWARFPRVNIKGVLGFDTRGGQVGDQVHFGVWPIDRYTLRAVYQVRDNTVQGNIYYECEA